MRDNEIWQVIIPLFKNGLALHAGAVEVKQNYQPTTQGANTAPTLYLTKLFDHRYGHPGVKELWNADAETFDHVETQGYETHFQATATATPDPNDVGAFTASDIANAAAAIIASERARATLQAAGLSILRITEVRNPKWTDEKDRYEAAPSFDFILAHERLLTDSTPAAVAIELRVERV